MPQHKTRKQLRLEAESATAKLATLDTPEGLAALIFHKQRTTDDTFQDAVLREVERLSLLDLQVTEDELDGAIETVAEVAAEDEDEEDGEKETVADEGRELSPVTYRVRHASGPVLANSLLETLTGDELAALAAAHHVLVSDLTVEAE